MLSRVPPDADLLAAGTVAPDFTLRQRASSGQIHLASMVRERPVILVFGSYTCPKVRFEARALNAMYERYHGGFVVATLILRGLQIVDSIWLLR